MNWSKKSSSLCYLSNLESNTCKLQTCAELPKKMGNHMQDDVAFGCVTDYIYNTNIFYLNFFIIKRYAWYVAYINSLTDSCIRVHITETYLQSMFRKLYLYIGQP